MDKYTAELLAKEIPNDCSWVAQDENCEWFAFTDKPRISHSPRIGLFWKYEIGGCKLLFIGDPPVDASKEIYRVERKVTFLQVGENDQNQGEKQ